MMEKTKSSSLYQLSRTQLILNKAINHQKPTSTSISKPPSPSRKNSTPLNNSHSHQSSFQATDSQHQHRRIKSILSPSKPLLSSIPSTPSLVRFSINTPGMTTGSFFFPKTTKNPVKIRIAKTNNNTFKILNMTNSSQQWDSFQKEKSINLEQTQQIDYTSDQFFKGLMNYFRPVNKSGKPTATLFIGKNTKQVSIKHAQRILQGLIDTLKLLKDLKFGDNTGLKRTLKARRTSSEEPSIKLKRLKMAIDECIELCQKAIADRNSKTTCEKHIVQMQKVAETVGNPELTLYVLFMMGKLKFARCDYRPAINDFKAFKELCFVYDVFTRRIEAYKMLGKCYSSLKKHKTALIYFTKFLYMAYYMESSKYELIAYDLIGIQYYYLGKLQLAEHYHNRMVTGELEPENSRIRSIGLAKMKLIKAIKSMEPGMSRPNEYDPELDVELHLDQNRIGRNIETDEEEREVSSFDEGFEPPIPNIEDEAASVSPPKNKYGQVMRIKNDLKQIPGFVRARATLQKKIEDRRNQRSAANWKAPLERQNSSPKRSHLSLQAIVKSTSASFFNVTKPTEQILTSHLSRNRELKNFSALKSSHYNAVHDPKSFDDELDLKSADHIKMVLYKMKVNLEVVRDSLVAAHPGSGFSLNDNTDKIKIQDDQSHL